MGVRARAAASDLEPFRSELIGYCYRMLGSGFEAEDAVQSMPPFAMRIHGSADIGGWMVRPGPSGCRGSRLVPTSANGCPAFGQYRLDPAGGHAPWALQVLEISRGRITEMSFFLALLDPERLFPEFGLPLNLDAQAGDPRSARMDGETSAGAMPSPRAMPFPRRAASSPRRATSWPGWLGAARRDSKDR